MNISYMGKKTTVKDSFKEYAEKRLQKLDKFFDDSPSITVLVTNQNEIETVEVTVKSQGVFFRAERDSNDRFTSLDMAVDVLSQQIVRNKNRLEKRFRSVKFLAEEPLEEVAPDALVRTKKFDVGVMDVEEAILQMNMLSHHFFMFRNGETGEINVVYRRKDNNYGLLEPVPQ